MTHTVELSRTVEALPTIELTPAQRAAAIRALAATAARNGWGEDLGTVIDAVGLQMGGDR